MLDFVNSLLISTTIKSVWTTSNLVIAVKTRNKTTDYKMSKNHIILFEGRLPVY